jgi:hypothetical protein
MTGERCGPSAPERSEVGGTPRLGRVDDAGGAGIERDAIGVLGVVLGERHRERVLAVYARHFNAD